VKGPHSSLSTRRSSVWLRLLLPGCILAGAGLATAQQSPVDSLRSTRAGVYTAGQAARGGNLYALSCASCHTAISHTGPTFVAKWDGRSLAELVDYVCSQMPKSEPGSLSRREYILVVAYLLKLNGMPAGRVELPADSVALGRIRIEFKAPGPPSRER
jgi:mono/diheme cytochrome c family protein